MAVHLWSGGARRSIMERGGKVIQREIQPMRRVVVMGPPGAGKSTLARHLGTCFGLPVFHLDQIWWRPGWIQAPPDAFAAEVARIAAQPAWVTDGNYTATIHLRLSRADTVIVLDIPTWLAMLRVIRRALTGYGRVRPDMSPGCPEKLDLAFLRFVWTWNRDRRARHLALLESFGGQIIILKGPLRSGHCRLSDISPGA